MDCDFCKDSSIEKRKIAENELAKAFLNKMPIVPGHILIIPKRCVAKLEELTENEMKAILKLKFFIKDRLVEKLSAEGFNYAWNEGAVAGQTVAHFHLHILPRKVGDSGITEYEPRKYLYRPDQNRSISTGEELAQIVRKLLS